MELFNPQNKVSALERVISLLKNGNRNFYEILNLPSDKFENASFDLLMANSNDVLAGVNKVRMLFDTKVFGIFNNILIKYHDNGDVKAVFYGTTSNARAVLDFFDQLVNHLGMGIYNEEFSSFLQKENVESLANGLSSYGTKDVIHYWSLSSDTSVVLQYTVIPLQEFSLLINLSAPMQIDYGIRRNGTIAGLLKLNIYELLGRDFLNEGQQEVKNSDDKYEYDYRLMQPEFDYFTRVLLTVGGEQPKKGELWRFNIVLYKSGEPNTILIRSIAERLIKLYGMDNHGSGDLEPYEFDKIDNNEFWTGRTWMFNNMHGLWKDADGEPLSYYVRMDNMGDEYGFKVTIVSANKMFELFTID